jgi:hypothetical protein
VDLQHLNALQQLQLTDVYSSSHSLVLSPHVSQVLLQGCNCKVGGGAGVLQAGLACVGWQDICTLESLSKLPSIQELSARGSFLLGFTASDVAHVAAVQQAAASVRLATGLTQLELVSMRSPTGQVASAGWCAAASTLPQLQVLRLDTMSLGQPDLLRLSSLSSLRSLNLFDTTLDDVAATALAVRLTQLHQLRMSSPALTSTALLPVLAANLVDLSSLTLGLASRPGDKELALLSPLTRLPTLCLCGHKCSPEAQQAFLAGMPHLTCVGR